MWTDTTGEKHARKGLRYSSDLKDADWAILEPMLPQESQESQESGIRRQDTHFPDLMFMRCSGA